LIVREWAGKKEWRRAGGNLMGTANGKCRLSLKNSGPGGHGSENSNFQTHIQSASGPPEGHGGLEYLEKVR